MSFLGMAPQYVDVFMSASFYLSAVLSLCISSVNHCVSQCGVCGMTLDVAASLKC